MTADGEKPLSKSEMEERDGHVGRPSFLTRLAFFLFISLPLWALVAMEVRFLVEVVEWGWNLGPIHVIVEINDWIWNDCLPAIGEAIEETVNNVAT